MGYSRNTCPHCGVSLLGDPIPDDIRHLFSGTHWRRDIAVQIHGAYDGALYYQCPDCGGAWHRWPEGTRQHTLAQPHITKINSALERPLSAPPTTTARKRRSST